MVSGEGLSINVELKFKLSIWSAIKIRLAGFNNCEVNSSQKFSTVTLSRK